VSERKPTYYTSDHRLVSIWTKLAHFDFLRLTRRELRIILFVALAAVALVLWYLFTYLQPPPPKVVKISTGAETGAYYRFAKQYQPLFAKQGIQLEIVTSAGTLDNLSRLDDPKSGVDLAFAQGGVSTAEKHPQIESLASVAFEPVWLVFNPKSFPGGLQYLSNLKGKRLGIGPVGSGARSLSNELLKLNQLNEQNVQLVDISGTAAVEAVQSGQIDATLLVAAIEAPVIQKALDLGLSTYSFNQADAYARLFPWAAKVTLPKGAGNMAKNFPAQDVELIAATANLVARKDLHRAIMFLALDVASTVHQRPSALSSVGDFPSEKNLDFPQAEESKRFFKTGRPFLQRYVPFWLANLLERLFLMLGPILAIGFPLVKLIPAMIGWKEQSELAQIYDEVLAIAYAKFTDEEGRKKTLERLDEIEAELPHLGMTAHFFQGMFSLKAHIDMARRHLINGPTVPGQLHPAHAAHPNHDHGFHAKGS
jgi:TRAP-type uncharacterized transport system substrate-binding protein